MYIFVQNRERTRRQGRAEGLEGSPQTRKSWADLKRQVIGRDIIFNADSETERLSGGKEHSILQTQKAVRVLRSHKKAKYKGQVKNSNFIP